MESMFFLARYFWIVPCSPLSMRVWWPFQENRTCIPFFGSGYAGLGFWVPTIIQGVGVKSTLTIGMLSTVPYIGALIGMVLVSRHSDRTLERRYNIMPRFRASLAPLAS